MSVEASPRANPARADTSTAQTAFMLATATGGWCSERSCRRRRRPPGGGGESGQYIVAYSAQRTKSRMGERGETNGGGHGVDGAVSPSYSLGGRSGGWRPERWHRRPLRKLDGGAWVPGNLQRPGLWVGASPSGRTWHLQPRFVKPAGDGCSEPGCAPDGRDGSGGSRGTGPTGYCPARKCAKWTRVKPSAR